METPFVGHSPMPTRRVEEPVEGTRRPR